MSRRPAVWLSLAVAAALVAAPMAAAAAFVSWPTAEMPGGTAERTSDSAAAPLDSAPAAVDVSVEAGVAVAPAARDVSEKELDGVRYRAGTLPAPLEPAAPALSPVAPEPQGASVASWDASDIPSWNWSNTSWNWSNWTLTVEAGNFSHGGINCSWENFTWSAGESLLDVVNVTCDLESGIRVTIQNGNISISWSNGTWSGTLQDLADAYREKCQEETAAWFRR